MSLRRYRRRGGVLIRDSGTNYTVDDCRLQSFITTWVYGKGFWYSEDYITNLNSIKFDRIAYPSMHYSPWLGNTDNEYIEDYCQYNDFQFTSGGDYIGYLIYPKLESDNLIDFVCCFHFRYETLSDLKSEIGNLEKVCLNNVMQSSNTHANVAFAFTQQMNEHYHLLPVMRDNNITTRVTLGGRTREQIWYNVKRTIDYYGNFYYLPVDYSWVQWWIIKEPKFLHGVNFANHWHFKGILASLGGSHYLTNTIDVNHFTLNPSDLPN